MTIPYFNLLLAAVIFMTASTAAAEKLTLDKCLEKAAANNRTLKTAAWDSRIASENVRLASSTLYPRLDAQAGYTIQHKPQAVFISGRTAETQEGQYATATLAANYTIYDFGRRSARTDQTRLSAESVSSRFKALQKDISLQVIEAYFGILETGKLKQSADEEVVQIEQHRKIAQIMYEEGVVTRNDVLQADVRLAAARQKQLAMGNNRENAWLLLNELTGTDSTYRAELQEDATMPAPAGEALDVKQALNSRHEIAALKQALNADEAEVKESRSNFMPEIFTRLGMDYVQNDKAREQAIFSAMIGIRMNIFDGFSSSATHDRAVGRRARSQELLRQTESRIQLEIATIKNDVRVAAERIAVAETAIKQSEENLRINRERYRERVGTATEVLDAQTLLTQTRTDYFKAFYDHQIATARLKHALGNL